MRNRSIAALAVTAGLALVLCLAGCDHYYGEQFYLDTAAPELGQYDVLLYGPGLQPAPQVNQQPAGQPQPAAPAPATAKTAGKTGGP